MLLYWILLPIVWVLAHIVFRIQVIGRENLKAVRDGRAYVIAPNHIANLDPVLIAITIFDWKRLRILAKEELFKNPLAGWFLRCMGAVSIERGKGDTVTLEKITNECKNGTGVMIFPEGTRHQPEMMQEVESGTAIIALRARVPLLPVYIDGKIRPFHITHIYYGKPMELDDLYAQGVNNDTAHQLCQRIHDVFYAMRDEVHASK